ncbi:MAG TPA: hypothetical protein VHY20_05750, partial [Pirellulales bacterium]|nr:hypothetical protein [Pirellulales bacterium]
MNSSDSLSLVASPWSIAGGLCMLLATAALCFAAWRRSGYRRDLGLLELLRLAIVGCGALLLNQPEWVEEYRPEEKPSIAVLCDASASMDLRDAPSSVAASAGRITRREAIAELSQSAFWKPLEERLNVVVQPFSPTAEGHGTNLYEPLAKAPQQFKNLRAIVLASDGDWNEGEPPVQAASALRIK